VHRAEIFVENHGMKWIVKVYHTEILVDDMSTK
jgi:hypothetical protein